LRHGERVDFVFGSSWFKTNFKENKYIRSNLNMPETLPPREFTDDWDKDSPLTTLGNIQAGLVGSSLKNNGVKFSHVFVSPSYRCLETATSVLKAMGLEKELPLNVDYGLFEWIDLYTAGLPGWYVGGLPKFLPKKERAKIFNVNDNYNPTMSRSELLELDRESFEDFYERNEKATIELLSKVEGDVLIVGHASNLDTSTRKLIGNNIRRNKDDGIKLLLKVPYLAAMAMEQTGESSFRYIQPPCLTFTHSSSNKFHWSILDDDANNKL